MRLSLYLLLFEITTYIGYFLFMIIFMSIAIATAKSKAAWIWYVIGAGIQLLALLGNQKTANVNGTETSGDWIFYVVLLFITAVIIDRRYKKAITSSNENPEETPKNHEEPTKNETTNNEINYKFDKVTSCIVWGAAILLVALIVICVICG